METQRRPIVDFTDEEARRALILKWGIVEPDVLPAWVAEMDYQLDPVVHAAVQEAVAAGVTGYPVFPDFGGKDPLVADAYVAWSQRHFGWAPQPEALRMVSDVSAGVRILIDVLSDDGPVIYPTPGYNAQFGLPEVTGRRTVEMPLAPGAERAEIDLDHLDRLFAEGARTLLLTQPHNPWGRVFTRAELEGIRDVVVRHGARVVSDEIHAPLVLPGAEHVPYLSIEGTHDHAAAVVAASKAFNTAGLRCAQMIVPTAADRRRLDAEPMSRNDSWSPLGVVAAATAYAEGDPWLASLVERLDQQRTLLTELLATHLPEVRMRPLEATYLPWLDAGALGLDDAAGVALERGRVKVGAGPDYGGTGAEIRLNIATSPERLTEIIRRLASAWRTP